MSVHGKNSDIYRNGTDLSLSLRSFTMSGEVELGDCTNFNDAQRAFSTGLKNGTFAVEGLWEGAFDIFYQRVLGKTDDATEDNNEPQEWQVFPGTQENTSLGAIGYACRGITTNYEITSVVDDIVTFTVDVQADEAAMQRVVVIQQNAPQTATGTGTTTDNGAASSNGADFVLMFSAISGGAPSVTVEVKGSTDNFVSNSSTLATFTAYTGASSEAAAERISVTGAIPRYVRCEYTLSGGTTSSTFWVTEHRKP